MECLEVINKLMADAGFHYEFGRMSKVYSLYFVGSYQEVSSSSENGMQELTFYLDCYTTGSYSELEQAKEKIKQLFWDYTTVTKSGTGIAISYESVIPVPIDTADYKHIQINLNVKEWSVSL